MNQTTIDNLGAEIDESFIESQVLYSIPTYKMKVDDIDVYFSQCSFRGKNDLRRLDLVDFFLRKDIIRSNFKVSVRMMDDIDFIKKIIKRQLNKQFE